MREIVFRGKGRKDGKWFYGNLWNNEIYGKTHIDSQKRGCLDIDPETVGQFTGLCDDKGNKIFEGDILEVESLSDNTLGQKFKCKVFFYRDTASFMVDQGCQFIPYSPLFRASRFMRYYPLFRALGENRVVVIGNIHDNQELITNKPSEQ